MFAMSRVPSSTLNRSRRPFGSLRALRSPSVRMPAARNSLPWLILSASREQLCSKSSLDVGVAILLIGNLDTVHLISLWVRDVLGLIVPDANPDEIVPRDPVQPDGFDECRGTLH